MSESLDALVGRLQDTLAQHRIQFVQFLQTRVQGTISIKGPITYENGKYEEIYSITLDETLLGEYKVEYAVSDEEIKKGADGKIETQHPRIRSAKVLYTGIVPGYEHPYAQWLREEGKEVPTGLDKITVHCEYDPVGSKECWRQPAHTSIPFRIEQ